MEQTEFEKKKQEKKKQKRKKVLRILIPIIIIGILAFIFFPKKGTGNVVSTVTVKKEIIKDQIQISGYIEAAQQQVLQPPGEGLVKRVKVKEGDKVKKGDLIFALDTSYQEMQVAKQEFAIAQEEISGASKRLTLMQKELELLLKQLEDRSVYAKFDGIIASFDLSEGVYVLPKDIFGTIIDRSYLKATVSIAETDASRLAINQTALLSFQAIPGTELTGKVTAYPSIAKINSQRGTTVIDAKIKVDNPPENILPGYSFSGKIIAGEDEEVLLVEQSAIFYDKGVPFVEKIIGENKTEKINVEILPYMRGFVKVISGLNEGDVLKSNSGSGGMGGW